MTIEDKTPKILHFSPEKQRPSHVPSIEEEREEAKLLRELYAHCSLVYRRCLSILRNEEDARDITHDVFERLLRLKAKGTLVIRAEKPEGFLTAIAETMSLDELKKRRRELIKCYGMATNVSLKRLKDMGTAEIWESLKTQPVNKPGGVTANGLPAAGFTAIGFADTCFALVDEKLFMQFLLKEEDAKAGAIIFMRYFDGMTYTEIGEIEGLKKSAVEARCKKFEERYKKFEERSRRESGRDKK